MTNLANANVCKCGLLIENVEDPTVPLITKDGQVLLILLDKTEQDIQFCFVCGGYELNPVAVRVNKCECHILEEWSKNENFPVKFDQEINEYYLVGEDKGLNVLYFCPMCGGKLAESLRGNFFVAPSESAVDNIYEKLKNVKSVNEIIDILGVPDEKISSDSEEVKKENLLGREVAKQTLIYHSIDDSFSLIIVEDDEEKIHFLYAGKPKI